MYVGGGDGRVGACASACTCVSCFRSPVWLFDHCSDVGPSTRIHISAIVQQCVSVCVWCVSIACLKVLYTCLAQHWVDPCTHTLQHKHTHTHIMCTHVLKVAKETADTHARVCTKNKYCIHTHTHTH
jgi:hypothetical protein